MIEALIARWGLLALFFGAGIEGETVVVLGGIAAHHGLFGLGPAIAFAAAGSFVADQTCFMIGRRFRDTARVKRLFAKPAFALAIGAFERHPTGFVLAFRFLYGLRTISPIAIGSTHIATWRFVLLNLIAAIVWATIFVTLGYLFGHAIETVMGRLLRGAEWAVPAVTMLALGWLVARRARRIG